ncbi:NifB/NifX family molybdenum-iron cluster-binding protein [Thermosipho melanesiensis]|uniref:Dinitrogenase iron-molybdenum cofactor biosynthesis protein n=1 Tax=Thermosipho melanesiensis (strain DSM 12029 / CIP 104789 / BI429) TaxID=391009 RepID=A6LIY9_THEM4|nr:NifB/NifX family molybdenum-iron cluster-binding protein [Thermosipho melanesiensis]ABR29890.1 Dinitrogenase iron-molybdenum cofactor biosynthesis protein [Thermosipho melanesiensis BI429]
MKIAFGTNDGIFMNEEHFGHSKLYVIYDYKDGEFKKVEEIKNPYAETHMHAKVEEIKEFLGHCDVWVGKSMGKASMMKLKDWGYRTLLVEADTVEEALKEISTKLVE